MDNLEKQLKASLAKLLVPLRKRHEKAVKLSNYHYAKAKDFAKEAVSISQKIRDIEKATGIKTWTQRKIAAQSIEERSDVTPEG